MESLGIADLAGAEITRLSGGQRQMILIARALAQGAQVVVMDEPTASLDLANRIRVAAAIRQLAGQGTAVILSTHDPDQAADRRNRRQYHGVVLEQSRRGRRLDVNDVPSGRRP